MSVDILNFYSQIDIYKDPTLINTRISDKEIKQQNEKIEISYKAVDDKIAEYKLIIDEQDKTIKDQDKVIQEQCTTISLLAKKVNFALSISALSIVSFAGFLLYFWFVL